MAINKFQRSMLTFALSARSFMLAKIYTNYFGHMTKMAATPIYGKNPLKIFFSGTRRLMTFGLGMEHLWCWAYQVCSNNDPRLTYLTSRSNLLPNAFEYETF